MSKFTKLISSLGNENLPGLIIFIGLVMLSWIFFLGDMVLGTVQ